MKLSKTSAHAALAMAVLATQPSGNFLQAREIARQIGIPTVSALKILQTLARQELIHSQLGRSGGYALATSAERVTLLQVVEAIDGPISGQMRVGDTPATFASGVNLLQSVCDATAQRIRDELSRTTVADIAALAGKAMLQAAS